jgi:hypothetical protein
MLPLVIVWPIKAGSFANGYRSISGERWHDIIIEGHRVVRRLLGVAIFAWGGVYFGFLFFCPKLLVLDLELLKLFHKVLQGWSIRDFDLEPSSMLMGLPSLSNFGGTSSSSGEYDFDTNWILPRGEGE